MRLLSPAIWRTSAFRLAAIYLMVFGATVGLGFVLVYQSTVGVIDRQTRQTIVAELGRLSDQYRAGGLNRLVRVIEATSRQESRREEIYLLTDANFEHIAGNLTQWPKHAPTDEWFEFPIERADQARRAPRQAMGRTFQLRGGYRLLVGRDTEAQMRFRTLFLDASAWIALATAFVGLITGLVLSRRVLKRVDTVAHAGENIASGNFDSRLPLAGSGDEFDRLSTSFNAMLDRIEGLMSGMRLATDSISHDVRRPLTRLRAKLDLALSQSSDGDEAQDAMGTALEEIDATVLILDNLLKIARAEAGVAGDTWRAIDLATLTRDAAELYQPVAEDKGVTLEYNLNPAPIQGEPQLLAQAIANLIDNAIKFSPAQTGQICIETFAKGDMAMVQITDNGPGIAQDDRARATDRFVRLDDGSRATEGSGLGLSLVRAVAHMHGGEIELGDGDPGLRAIFSLTATPKSVIARHPAANLQSAKPTHT
jgi:signal transduction histidine kinase